MDTEEMYQRGVADAERGEPHPFYYQHYYHYRRGYDRTRRHLRLPAFVAGGSARYGRLVLGAVMLIALGGGAFLALRSRPQATLATRTPITILTVPVTMTVPVRSPLFPTAAPSPVSPMLHAGGMALVANTEGQPLRGRQEPHLKAPAKVAFKEGEQVRVLEGPVAADGYSWWRIEGKGGTGWSAERSKEGTVWLQPTN